MSIEACIQKFVSSLECECNEGIPLSMVFPPKLYDRFNIELSSRVNFDRPMEINFNEKIKLYIQGREVEIIRGNAPEPNLETRVAILERRMSMAAKGFYLDE